MGFTDFFDKVQKHLQAALPFVVYKKPNVSDIQVLLQKDNKLYTTEDYSESGFVFAPFNDQEVSVLLPLEACEVLKTKYELTSEVLNATPSEKEVIPSAEKREEHIALVQNGVNAINNKELQKVVLSRCEAINISEENPLETFKRLLYNYPTAFVYCWFHPKVGLWLGATPETLISISNNRFKTMSLAGTQKYHGTEDVIWQEKEKEEQQIVTDFIVSSLEPLVKSIQVSKTQTARAGSLLHLKTAISGTIDTQDSYLKEVLKAIHPTPAVCGFPKEKAKQYILKNENYHREFYSGFLGELNLKESQTRNTNRRNVENNAYATIKTVTNLFVNLRCMQLKDKQALLYVGGGITGDSVPENEWQETVNKTQTIKKVL